MEIFQILLALCKNAVSPNVWVPFIDNSALLRVLPLAESKYSFLEPIQQRDGLPTTEFSRDFPEHVTHFLFIIAGDISQRCWVNPHGPHEVHHGIQGVSFPHFSPPISVKIGRAPDLVSCQSLGDGTVPFSAGCALAGPFFLANGIGSQAHGKVPDAMLPEFHAG